MIRGCSSIGRAPALQAGGRRFDSVQLHHLLVTIGLGAVLNIALSLFEDKQLPGSVLHGKTYRACSSVG